MSFLFLFGNSMINLALSNCSVIDKNDNINSRVINNATFEKTSGSSHLPKTKLYR